MMSDAEAKLVAQIRELAGDDVYIAADSERIDGRRVDWIPTGRADLDRLPALDEETLLAIGLERWDGREDVWTLWLYPSEWYEALPDGLPIVTIFGAEKVFKAGDTSRSKREGCLAYGFITGDRETALREL